jgi:hypothetical protein
MPDLDRVLQELLQGLRQGTAVFLSLLCFLAFAVNAGLLVWLIVKKGSSELARCPKCGRNITCPHCVEDENEDEEND